MEKANIPIEYGDVIVRISTPDSGEYETIKIADMQSEVANVLYAIPFLIVGKFAFYLFMNLFCNAGKGWWGNDETSSQ